jgi:hypothetical protein
MNNFNSLRVVDYNLHHSHRTSTSQPASTVIPQGNNVIPGLTRDLAMVARYKIPAVRRIGQARDDNFG